MANETPTAEQQYLELQDGENIVWFTGIKTESDGAKAKIKLTVATEPSSVNFTAPFTNLTLNAFRSDDPAVSLFAKIQMDRKVKATLFPLAEVEPGTKIKMSELVGIIKDRLAQYDIQARLFVKLNAGKQLNKDGNVRYFPEPVSVELLDAKEKGTYESDIEWDDFDVMTSSSGNGGASADIPF